MTTPVAFDDIPTAVMAILAEIAEVGADEVRPDQSLREDLELDSLAIAELTEAISQRFDLKIPDKTAYELTTVDRLVSYVLAAVGAATQ